MEGIISNFRMSRHRTRHYQMIVKPAESHNLESAKQLIGSKVVWKSPAGKEIAGAITKEHGRNGYVRVLFESGMPGQAISNKVEIYKEHPTTV